MIFPCSRLTAAASGLTYSRLNIARSRAIQASFTPHHLRRHLDGAFFSGTVKPRAAAFDARQEMRTDNRTVWRGSFLVRSGPVFRLYSVGITSFITSKWDVIFRVWRVRIRRSRSVAPGERIHRSWSRLVFCLVDSVQPLDQQPRRRILHLQPHG